MKKGMLFVGVSSLLYGLIPLATKALYAAGMNVVSVSFWRFALMIPILAMWCPLAHYRVRMPLRSVLEVFLRIGLFSGLTMFLLNQAYSSMDVGLATTIHYLYPAIVVLIAVFVFHERAGAAIIKAVVLIAIGMALISLQSGPGASASGLICALASAVTYAIYIIQLEKSGFNRINPLVLTLYTAVCNSLLMFTISGPLGGIQVMGSPSEWVAALALALLCLGALALLAHGSKFLNAGMTSVFGLFEPLTSMVVGVAALGEVLSAVQLLGCTFILIAIVLVAFQDKTKVRASDSIQCGRER